MSPDSWLVLAASGLRPAALILFAASATRGRLRFSVRVVARECKEMGNFQRTLWTVLLAILVLIVFWLVMRFWHMRCTSPNPHQRVGLQRHACADAGIATAA
jgi:di/tricarboxylate transporter